MLKHDFLDGQQGRCQICENTNLELVIDLGKQPLADKLLPITNSVSKQTSYPLTQVWCNECGLYQLNYICPADVMFGDDYNYKTGVTKELVEYQYEMAAELCSALGLESEDLVCDLGSNDGTLLKGFMSQGVRVIGVEPTDIADLANQSGITTIRMPFGETAAKFVIEKAGRVSLATATNVFAHVQKLGDFLRGLNLILKE